MANAPTQDEVPGDTLRRDAGHAPPHQLVWLIVWGALAGALAELGARVVVWRFGGSVVNSFTLNPQAIWLAPLANLPLFGAVAGAVALAIRDPRRRLRACFAAVVTLVVLEVGLVSERIHPAALAALGLGLGVQCGFLLARWPRRNWQFIRATTLLLVAVSVAGGVAWNVRAAVLERRAVAALRAATPGAPNVLLLILDTVGARDLSLHGYPLETSPVLRRLAREGVRFDRAIAPSSWTLASHASMFTGRLPNQLSVGWARPLDHRWPTLAEAMARGGYATGGFVANLLYGSWLHGLNRGFIRYRDYVVSPGEALYSSSLWRNLLVSVARLAGEEIRPGRVTAARVNEEFLDWQASIGDRPFFGFLNYFDAHTPYAPPAPFDTMFLGRRPRMRTAQFRQPETAAEYFDMRRAYDGAIRYIDREIGRLLEELERRGVLRQTLVIVTADHGEAFGERGFQGHGTSLYAGQIWVPLLVLLPGRTTRDTAVMEPVSLVDLAATVLDVTKIRRADIPGISLAQLWDGSRPRGAESSSRPVFAQLRRPGGKTPRIFPVAGGDLATVIAGGWQLIHRSDGRVELYRVGQDPLSKLDLADSPEFAGIRSLLQGRLADTLRARVATAVPRPTRPAR